MSSDDVEEDKTEESRAGRVKRHGKMYLPFEFCDWVEHYKGCHKYGRLSKRSGFLNYLNMVFFISYPYILFLP